MRPNAISVHSLTLLPCPHTLIHSRTVNCLSAMKEKPDVKDKASSKARRDRAGWSHAIMWDIWGSEIRVWV